MIIIALLALLLFLGYFNFSYQVLKRQLRMMQQGDYRFDKYVDLAKTYRKTESMWVMVGSAAVSFLARNNIPILQYYLLHIIVFATLGLLHRRKPVERSPVMDGRMIRLSVGAVVLFFALLLLMGVLFRHSFWWELPFVLTFLGFFSDIWIILANSILRPYEKRHISKRFRSVNSIAAVLAKTRADSGRKPLRIVGVTGSYGKSNFLDIASQILSTEYQVLRSQPDKAGSLENAEKLIREGLTSDCDLMLIEIASKHQGDVKEFCATLMPDFGVVTGIAERNMGTFNSIDQIAETQMEIADCLRTSDGLLVLNYEDGILRKQKADSLPLLRYGIYQGGGAPSHLDIWASDIKYRLGGSEFILHDKAQLSCACSIPLTGAFNLLHCIGAIGLALHSGMTLNGILSALPAIKPRKGYLRVLPEGEWLSFISEKAALSRRGHSFETSWPASITVVDDSLQTSLEGAKDSLTMLKDCEGCRILLTPGLRNQGSQEEEYNRRLGRHAARCCDKMVVIGKEAVSAVEDGASRGGFASDDIYPALDEKDALQKASRLAWEAADVGRQVFLIMLGR